MDETAMNIWRRINPPIFAREVQKKESDSEQKCVCFSYLFSIHKLLTSNIPLGYGHKNSKLLLRDQMQGAMKYCTEKQLKFSGSRMKELLEIPEDHLEKHLNARYLVGREWNYTPYSLNTRAMMDAARIKPFTFSACFIGLRVDKMVRWSAGLDE